MQEVINKCTNFFEAIKFLGFNENDDTLFLIDKTTDSFPELSFFLDKARELGATAVYFRKLITGTFQPQIYLYDCTDKDFHSKNEIEITEYQRKIWSSGECPIACFFYKTEIKIVDCTNHITDKYKPSYLIETLKTSAKAPKLYNEQFAIKIKSGVFWEEEDVKNKFKFATNSAYNKLIKNIHSISSILKNEYKNLSGSFLNKIIIQAILIKYLEERIDENGNELLSDKYFKQFDNASTFIEVLSKGKFVELLNALNNPKTGFNGNVFRWTREEQEQLKELNLSRLAELLDTKKTNLTSPQQEIAFPNWRYFEFKYIPVELISRLYEEFLGENKQEEGLYYTPSHIAKLLVDDCLPLSKYKNIDVNTYRILDPACGSGIFLVSVFKRLVQIWRLQNNMAHPSMQDLKNILRNIYGVDKEEQAVELASFSLSLALCNELQPIEIINNLKFDNLKENNLIWSDFFKLENKLQNLKFDLVIGNPPFNRGAISNYTEDWEYNEEKIKIPQGQIALKFLSESIPHLKEKGLLCLIIKSSGLLYNSTSTDYKRLLFSNFNVVQIFDFTALARNKALWDNGADVESAAIFLKKEKPKAENNILHLTFRRTKATKERIVFEIDDYDLHFIDRISAIENPYIWKSNLLGGGRINNTVRKLSTGLTLGKYIENSLHDHDTNNHLICTEGVGGGMSIPQEAFINNELNYEFLKTKEYLKSFENKKEKKVYAIPNVLINENIDLPFCYNERKFPFSNLTVGIHSLNESKLKEIYNFFKENHTTLRFFNIATSGKMLVYKNTACKKEDILNLPFLRKDTKIKLSTFDTNIISDVNIFMQDFLRHGENSEAIKPIPQNEFEDIFSNYGQEFSKVLNLIYEDSNRKFRLSDVVRLQNSYIATVFRYDTEQSATNFSSDYSKLNLSELSDFELSKQLTINRIIKLYPQKDTIVFVKPNQYRYWLSLIAYRDADKCFADLAKLGY